jgi:hypothetical protein
MKKINYFFRNGLCFFGKDSIFAEHVCKKNLSIGSGCILCYHGCFFIGMFCDFYYAAGQYPENDALNNFIKKSL